MANIFIFFILSFVFYSCNTEQKSFQYYTFKKQITPSGKYVIYEYARNGEMSFGSSILGTRVFKIDEKFSEDKGISINGGIQEWISDDTLLLTRNLNTPYNLKDTLPIDISYQKVGDFLVKNLTYNYYSSGSSIEFVFDSVYTTNDSIFIKIEKNSLTKAMQYYQIEKFKHVYNYLKFLENKKFSSPLGNIYIKTKKDTIDYIEVSTISINHMTADNKQNDGSTNYGLPGNTNITIIFIPNKNILTKGLNKRKIFWEVK